MPAFYNNEESPDFNSKVTVNGRQGKTLGKVC